MKTLLLIFTISPNDELWAECNIPDANFKNYLVNNSY